MGGTLPVGIWDMANRKMSLELGIDEVSWNRKKLASTCRDCDTYCRSAWARRKHQT